ncbi:T9SS type A sorting domain-containing protein [Psychroserpens mesophilus]|uniref:T9SS type A sorting domain-containing protein n=1 Tax=Psychroserpens mesophilus TaxID=325473 RepID=UPI00059138A2|nr:T9SS type A sorting domain-containing protein [Psychroserpens mesophilus]
MKKFTLIVFALLAMSWQSQAQLSFDNACTTSFDDISATGTVLVIGDDGESNITLPFSFTLDGVSSSALRVGDNGGILFGVTSGNVGTSSTPTAPGFYAFSDDLDSDYGDIRWEVLGTAPTRRAVIMWNNRPRYSNSASGGTFEIILYETSNEITFLYQDTDFGAGNIGNDAASAGIRVVGANGAYVYSTDTVLGGVTCINWFPPSCLDVSGLNLDSSTATSATISWTASASGETAWEIAVQADGTGIPGAADNSGANTTTNPHTEGGLSANTAYEVYVRAECTAGTDFGGWVGPLDFTTPCAAITPDYVANMSVNVPDSCWDEAGSGEVAAGPGGFGASDWRQNRAYAYGPSNAMNIYQTNTDREWLLSPTFDLSTGGPFQLEVNVAVTDYAFSGTTTIDGTMDSDDEVQLLISTDGGSTWSNLTTWNAGNEPDAAGTDYIEDLTAYTGNVQFAIWASDGATGGSQDYDFHVGKFNVNVIPSTETVDYCNLQFPASGSISEGGTFTAFARIYDLGFTEAGGANPDVEAWIGYSTVDAAVTADFETPNWTWVPASWNAQYGNDDEYSVEFGSALAAGSYYYVSRFRVDNGVFAYGGNDITDGDGGNFWDGSSFVSGQLDVIPPAPTTVATFNISGCGDSDTYSGTYDAGVDGIVWVELIYDGGCTEITVDNETTTGVTDTEIGIYDNVGNLVGNDDDGGTGNLGSLTELGLPAGTYYIASGAFNITFGATAFNATTSSTTATGNIVINASTPNLPDYVNLQFPGTATITAGNTATVYAQIFEAGNTNAPGAGTNITAEIGISAVDAAEVADFETVDWTWTTAPYLGEVGSNDEYALAIGAALAPGTYYYVSRFSVDGGPYVYGGNDISDGDGGDSWDGSSFVSGVLTVNPAGEPTNHVTSFSATADSDTEITLTWTDNDGAQAADGFLIVGKTGAASFYSPSDTVDPADETDWSDDEFEVKVGSGVETYTVTGLTASTLYDFEIYPYANSGALIDFKTDGTIPSASETTLDDPCASAVTSFPFQEGFESGVPPQCWTSFRGTNGEGTVYDWTTSATANTGSSSAFVRYENVATGAEDWLVTPALDLSVTANPELTFFAAQQFTGSFGSVYTIRVSTTDTDHASFTTVQTYTEADLPIVGTDGYSQFAVDLSAYNTDSTVYVAFVMTNDDGDNFFLDDVVIYDNVPTTFTYTSGTWAPYNPMGIASSDDDIIIASGDLVMNSDLSCNSMTISAGAGLTIDTGATLTTVAGTTLESSSTSYSSLILDGTVSGTINYERHININGSGTTGSNDLVSAPLTGQAFNLFAGANPNILNNGTLYLFGPFEKVTGSYVTWAGTETTTLDAGVGYRAATSDNSVVTFTGTAENGTITNDIINSGSEFAKWNLVGNPYPSYLNVQTFLLHDVGGVTNLQLFDGGTAAIYGYDGDASNGWTIYNLATTTASTVMAPGQGFFVSADATNAPLYDLEFTPAMRSTGTADDFIPSRNAELTYLKVSATTNTKSYATDFYFNNNASLGFDFGYDAEIWGSAAPDFGIYSHLVQDNTGLSMALQALNTSDLSDVTIPLGVNANQGEQLTFSIADTTLPTSVNVYLDDVVANTTTLLNNSDYVMTPNTNLSGTGRFFLRTSEDALSTIENSLVAINIFALNNSKELVVSGQLKENTVLDLFDIQGRKVLTTKLDNNSIENRIDVSNLSGGVYVVTVLNNGQQKTQKVIIK